MSAPSRLFLSSALIVQRMLEIAKSDDPRVTEYANNLLDTIGVLERQYDELSAAYERSVSLNQSFIASRSSVSVQPN